MEIVNLINEERKKASLSILKISSALMLIALNRSEEMVTGQAPLEHEKRRKIDLPIQEILRSNIGEVIFANMLGQRRRLNIVKAEDAQIVIRAWMNSDSHR